LSYTAVGMKIIALSDIHGNLESVPSLALHLVKADVVLLTGDLTHFGGRGEACKIVEAVRSHNSNILAVSGNCDHPDVESYLREEGISLHGDYVVRENAAFIGLGGSLPAPVRTPNELSEEAISDLLEGAMTRLKQEISERGAPLPLVLVSHQPPRDTAADRLLNGRHVGSVAVRSFIERWNPLVCFTGHIHEGRAVDTIGSTLVVNPGPASGLYFAQVDTSKNPVHVSLGEGLLRHR
jgi:Icc-related predicted phosphoesterase